MMSAKNRVNPDYYKLAGRDPQDRIPPPKDKQLFARQRGMDGREGNFIPGGDHAPGAMGMKQGMASGSQKAATSHYGTRAMASTRPVAGGFGREGAEPAVKRKKKAAPAGTKAPRTTKKPGARKTQPRTPARAAARPKARGKARRAAA